MWIRSTKAFNTHCKKLGKSKFGFERTAVSNFKNKRREGSGNELVDYSRAPCLGADQKARWLWERDWADCFCRNLPISNDPVELEFQEILAKKDSSETT